MIQRLGYFPSVIFLATILAKEEQASTPNATQKMYIDLQSITFELYKVMSKEKGNFVCYPYGFAVSMAMMLEGAEDATAEEIRLVLHYDNNGYFDQEEAAKAYEAETEERRKSDGRPYKTANSIWFQLGVEVFPHFISVMNRRFAAETRELDFSRKGEMNIVNEWGKKTTDDGVTEVVSSNPINPGHMPMFVTASVASFNLHFDPTIDKFDVRLFPFTQVTENGAEIKRVTKMMFFKGNFSYGINHYLNVHYQLVEIPYMEGRFGLVLVLPDNNGGLGELESKLTDDIDTDMYSMEENENVIVGIPEFEVFSVLRLAKYARALGVLKAFREEEANFTNMVVDEHVRLHAGEILQGVTVTLDIADYENRTYEVADLEKTDSTKVIADRPFIFLIREREINKNLFIGRVHHV